MNKIPGETLDDYVGRHRKLGLDIDDFIEFCEMLGWEKSRQMFAEGNPARRNAQTQQARDE